ncbi:MAG: TVP38/TMEM64 family protein [Hymenobacteraceae bacterium]|nr:TVP38/TMEM64 family protein [Hymenobacteraceae bacterium]MDX5396908.1 TVP38/TMEM64 family protein [Hymenobacteraceae bacterium]MDX5512982.1 TVP38/TMEM64 family protein [Hymenobacteraceae bacterium]
MTKTQSKKHTDQHTKQSKLPLYISLGIIAVLVALYFLWPGFQEGVKEAWHVLTSGDRKRISEWVDQFGIWGPFFIILFMIVQMFLIVINVVALMVVSVLAYGPVWGALIALAAVLTASTIGYGIGRWLGKSFVHKLLGQKSANKVEDAVEEYGFWAIAVARISPFLSNDAVSFVAGLAKMSYLRFMGASLLGIVPLTILIAWLGEDIDRLKNGLIWISVVTIVGFIAYVIYDKKFKKK